MSDKKTAEAEDRASALLAPDATEDGMTPRGGGVADLVDSGAVATLTPEQKEKLQESFAELKESLAGTIDDLSLMVDSLIDSFVEEIRDRMQDEHRRRHHPSETWGAPWGGDDEGEEGDDEDNDDDDRQLGGTSTFQERGVREGGVKERAGDEMMDEPSDEGRSLYWSNNYRSRRGRGHFNHRRFYGRGYGRGYGRRNYWSGRGGYYY